MSSMLPILSNFNTHPHTRMQRKNEKIDGTREFQYTSSYEDATTGLSRTFVTKISILIPMRGCNSDRYSYIPLSYKRILPHKRAFFNKQFIEKPHIFQPSVLSCTCNKNFGCIQLISLPQHRSIRHRKPLNAVESLSLLQYFSSFRMYRQQSCQSAFRSDVLSLHSR